MAFVCQETGANGNVGADGPLLGAVTKPNIPTARGRFWVLAAVLAATTFGSWSVFNPKIEAPDVVGRVHGAAYQPYRGDQSPTGAQPTVDEIDADLELLAQHMRAVRTYSSTGNLAEIPQLASKHGLKVLQGIWVDGDKDKSRSEIESGVPVARGANVTGILVGNEALLRGDLTVPQLVPYLQEVRRKTKKPVSTAEPWSVWMEHPELAKHTDFIALHILPYWEETTSAQAFDYTLEKIALVQKAFPKKRIVIAEVGWPSDGRARWNLTPGVATEGQFLRRVFDAAAKMGIETFAMEAFDGPWKYTIEGSVGPYWGMFDANRVLKFPLSGPIQDRPHWPWLAAFAAIGGCLVLAWLARRSPHRGWGTALQASASFAAASFVVWLLDVTVARYFTLPGAVAWGLLMALLLVLVMVLAADITEMSSVFDRKPRRRAGDPAAKGPVSIHLPIHAEPPAVVIETLRSLAALDWCDYEVIVVDNNTSDPALWQPVEHECRRLNEGINQTRFRFIHVEGLKGFKAGALNLALRETRPDAVAIGILDADYIVEPDWIARAMAQFDDPKIGFVQAPQDHRDIETTPFKKMIGWEYAGFFHIGMVQRDLDDAIIQHGTMALIRRTALEAVGGWGEWCITEDAELGLRVHGAGWSSAYIRDTLGRGLLPDDWAAYAKQRHRWAYGGMQVLRRQWRRFLPGSGLTPAQRLRYAAGWLPWMGDAIGFSFAFLSAVWTSASLLFPEFIELPDPILVLPALTAFLARVSLSFAAHRIRVPCGLGDSLRAAVAGVALAPTIGLAVLHGLLVPGAPFRRTPKAVGRSPFLPALRSVWLEVLLAGALLAAAATTLWFQPSAPAMALWVVALLLQSVPPFLAVGLALMAALPPRRTASAPAAQPSLRPA